MKSTTEQVQESKDRKILKGLGIKDWNEYMAEDDEGQTRKRKLQDKCYEVAVRDGDAGMLKFLAEQTFGKAKERVDLTRRVEGIDKIQVEFVDGEKVENDKGSKEDDTKGEKV